MHGTMSKKRPFRKFLGADVGPAVYSVNQQTIASLMVWQNLSICIVIEASQNSVG